MLCQFCVVGMWDACWLSVLSTRPVEKVLSGALTPSIAQTWSKPWRSSTSLPRMPSPHRLPPHPGIELSGAHNVTGVFSLVKPESDPSCLFVCCLFVCSASSPPRHLFLQGCSFKGKAGWVFTSLFGAIVFSVTCLFAVFWSRCLSTFSIIVLLSPILGSTCLLSVIEASSCTP